MKTLIIAVPGVRSRNEAENWNGKAVTHFHNKFGDSTEKCETLIYHTLAILRWKNHTNNVRRLISLINWHFGDWKIHIVCHSNGANIVLDALNEMHWPVVESLTMFSPACESNLSYLNSPLGSRIRRLKILIGERDIPLLLADNCIGRFLGYGALGRRGPEGIHADKQEDFVTVEREPTFGHSTWFDDEHFEQSMERVPV